MTGGIAEKWHVLDEGETLFFELRSGLKWSNGEDIDADEIVRSFQMLVDPASASPNSHNASAIRNALKIIGGGFLQLNWECPRLTRTLYGSN